MALLRPQLAQEASQLAQEAHALVQRTQEEGKGVERALKQREGRLQAFEAQLAALGPGGVGGLQAQLHQVCACEAEVSTNEAEVSTNSCALRCHDRQWGLMGRWRGGWGVDGAGEGEPGDGWV